MYFNLLFLLAVMAQQQTGRAVKSQVPEYRTPYLCNYAKVYNLKPESFLTVRSGPGMSFPQIDRLENGTVVYICDEHLDWVKVFYSGPEHPCGTRSTAGLDVREAGSCKAGWANRKWINVLSG